MQNFFLCFHLNLKQVFFLHIFRGFSLSYHSFFVQQCNANFIELKKIGFSFYLVVGIYIKFEKSIFPPVLIMACSVWFKLSPLFASFFFALHSRFAFANNCDYTNLETFILFGFYISISLV